MSDSHDQDPDFENLEGAGDDPSAVPTWYGGIVIHDFVCGFGFPAGLSHRRRRGSGPR